MVTRGIGGWLAAALVGVVLAGSAQAQNNNGGNNAGGNNNNNGGNFGGGTAGVFVSPDGVLRMKRFPERTGALALRWAAEARAKLGADLAAPSKLRKVSLTRLEAALAERLAANQPPTEEMKALAGLTSIDYIFCYPDSKDIVIAGAAEGFAPDASGRLVGLTTGQAILELQDLAVALRAYPPGGNPTAVISVSIDPTREGLQRMQQFLANLGRISPNDAARIAVGLRDNLGLQTVTVRGISPRTHFAQVLIEADYRMKLIGIGLEEPPAKIASYVSKANPRDVSRNALQRWYFTPNYDCVRVSEDELAMQLVGDGVKLVGEGEVVGLDGARAAAGNESLASKLFCQSFTTNYGQLARRSPVYAQMRNLIDLAIAAAFIQQQDYYGRVGWKMEVLGDEQAFAVETHETPKTVETAVNVIWKGNTLMTPVGGGVNIQARLALKPEHLLKDEQGELPQIRGKLGVEGLAKGQWWWD